jgi:hypothetical protein
MKYTAPNWGGFDFLDLRVLGRAYKKVQVFPSPASNISNHDSGMRKHPAFFL